jgi:hypothetical protein
MLIHAEHHWPEAVSTSMWPYAMRNACYIFTDARTLKGPHKDWTSSEIFSGIDIAAEARHHHTFGCPVYITAAQIHAGKSLPAWMSRGKVRINLGISPAHARSVALALSLKTGLVSPQFHVKHDVLFEATGYKVGRFGLPTSRWQELAGFKKGTISVTKQADPAEKLTRELGRSSPASEINTDRVDHDQADNGIVVDDEGPVDVMEEETVTVQPDPGEEEEVPISKGEPADGEPAVTTRSRRKVRMTTRMQESHYQRAKKWVSWAAHALRPPELSEEDEIYELFGDREYDIQDRASNPITFSATSDPDTMYWHQVMQEPDKAEFLKAAVSEVKSHVDNHDFTLMRRDELPKSTRVLAAVWSVKRKRRILTRAIYKWKARLNCHGGKEEHRINFWETYSPVVNWYSIQLFLIISIMKGWETRQIDFVLVFPQADIEYDIYMEVPSVGFDLKQKKKDLCLKLWKNINGTKQAGRV